MKNILGITLFMEEFFPLLRAFIQKKINACDFEDKYLDVFPKSDLIDDSIEEILSDIFFDVDEYCSDPALIETELDIDGDELYRRTLVNYNKLCSLLAIEAFFPNNVTQQ